MGPTSIGLLAASLAPALLSGLQKPAQTNYVSQLIPMIGAQNASQQALLDMLAKTPPQFTPIDINELNELMRQQALISGFASKAAEQQLDPETALLRDLESKDLVESYQGALRGDLPVGVQNALVRAGLGQAIEGGNSISPTSLGKGSAEKAFGLGSLEYLDKLRNIVSRKTASTPKPMAAVDPASAGEISVANTQNRDAVTNDFHNNLMNATFTANQNLSNLGTSLASGAIQESASNAGARNASRGNLLGSLTSLGGAFIKAYPWQKTNTVK